MTDYAERLQPDEFSDDELELMSDGDAEDGELYEHFRMEVDKGQESVRIDKYLSEHQPHSSRNRIQKAADAGFIHVCTADDQKQGRSAHPVKSNYKVRPGDVITLMLNRPHYDTTITPEDIPLEVVYEDDDLMVINKPAGMVVHPGCGNFSGTLVNAIAWHLKDLETYDPNDPEVGLVHRIDKDTSGLLVVAKTPDAKTSLGKQFFNKTTHRSYNALVWGNFVEDVGRKEISVVTRETVCGWRCSLLTRRLASLPSPIIRCWNDMVMSLWWSAFSRRDAHIRSEPT